MIGTTELDLLCQAVDEHIGLLEEGSMTIDDVLENITLAGQMINSLGITVAKTETRVKELAVAVGKCPLCEGGMYALDGSRPGRLEIVHSDLCPLYSEDGD